MSDCAVCCEAIRSINVGDWMGRVITGPPQQSVRIEECVKSSDASRTQAELKSIPGTDGKNEESLKKLERLGRYEIRKALGAGAFGHVYLSYDPATDRHVAIKIPSARFFQKGRSVDAFIDEAVTSVGLTIRGL